MSDQTGRRRFRVMAVCGALAAALLVLWIPVGVLETVVASSGVSEVLPATAPPLGMVARVIMAAFAGLMMVGIMALMRTTGDGPNKNKARTERVEGARQMGFAFSKLAALARGRITASMNSDVPTLRRADAHPDAPARSPIFASRDFNGIDIFPQPQAARPVPVEPDYADDMWQQDEPAVLAYAYEPVAEEDAPQPALLRTGDQPQDEDAAVETYAPMAEPDVAPIARGHAVPARGQSVAQLIERLEQGLSSRSRKPVAGDVHVIADMPVARPVAVRDSVAPDADDALRAALGALRTMAGNVR